MKQPPLHARKSFIFKVNETDYFGAYTKKKSLLAHPTSAEKTESLLGTLNIGGSISKARPVVVA